MCFEPELARAIGRGRLGHPKAKTTPAGAF